MKITLGPNSKIQQRDFEASASMPFVVKALSDLPFIQNKIDAINAAPESDNPAYNELVALSDRVLNDLATKLDIRNVISILFVISAALMAKHSPQQLKADGDPFTPFFIAQLLNFCEQSAKSIGAASDPKGQSLEMH